MGWAGGNSPRDERTRADSPLSRHTGGHLCYVLLDCLAQHSLSSPVLYFVDVPRPATRASPLHDRTRPPQHSEYSPGNPFSASDWPLGYRALLQHLGHYGRLLYCSQPTVINLSTAMAGRMLSSLVPSPSLDFTTPTKSRPSRHNTRVLSTSSISNAESSTNNALTRTAVSLEYASLRHTGHCPLGMYITPSPDNLMVWDAVFFVHQGTFDLYVCTRPARLPDSKAITPILSSSLG